MNDKAERIRKIQPKLTKRVAPGWLATTPDDVNLSIGVIGSTESDARKKFSYAIEKWADIFSQNTG